MTGVGTTTLCPVCSVPGQCKWLLCTSEQDSCLLIHTQLGGRPEKGTLIKNGTCVAPQDCPPHSYSLTVGPQSRLIFSCCKNNCQEAALPEAETEAQPNGNQCHYCLEASCDSLSVLNCSGRETSCVGFSGSSVGGSPQILMGCGTPEICEQQAMAALETSGFQLTSKVECHPTVPSTHPVSRKIETPLEADAFDSKAPTTSTGTPKTTKAYNTTHSTKGTDSTTKAHGMTETNHETGTHTTKGTDSTTKAHGMTETNHETGTHTTKGTDSTTKAHSTTKSPTTPQRSTVLKNTICFNCSDTNKCQALPCPLDKNYRCLQVAGVASMHGSLVSSFRKGLCVAAEDCRFSNNIISFTFQSGSGFWANMTCCQGHCSAPSPLKKLPVLDHQSKFLCPVCAGDTPGPCKSSLYMQCPSKETSCVQLDIGQGGQNNSIKGCGTPNLCSIFKIPGSQFAASWLPLRHVHCDDKSRAVLENSGHIGATPGLHLALPMLLVALGIALS